jgi:hypothetical protein
MSDASEEPRKRRWRCLLSVLGLLILLVVLLWRPVQEAREMALFASCSGQEKMTGLALLNYENQNHHYLPAYLADKEGRPAHSWRVLLLPQQECGDLYEQYRFNEPWNSPHNRQIAAGLPIGMSGIYPMYHCGCDRDSDKLDTSYVMVVGPDTISAGTNARKQKECTDGTSYTIGYAEMSESGIPWMEPRDLKYEEMSFRINDPQGRGLRSNHPRGVNAMFLDGTVRTLPRDIDSEVLKSAFRFSDGKNISAILDY